jgi:hypothetical protein
MNVAIDYDLSAQTSICVLQFGFSCAGQGCLPEIIGARMNQANASLRVQIGKAFEPMQAFFTDPCAGTRNHLLEGSEDGRELGVCCGQHSEALRGPKHLVSIAADTGPPKGADLIDDVSRWAPLAARSPPWRVRSGATWRRSPRTAWKARRLPWMSDTIAIRTLSSRSTSVWKYGLDGLR